MDQTEKAISFGIDIASSIITHALYIRYGNSKCANSSVSIPNLSKDIVCFPSGDAHDFR